MGAADVSRVVKFLKSPVKRKKRKGKQQGKLEFCFVLQFLKQISLIIFPLVVFEM